MSDVTVTADQAVQSPSRGGFTSCKLVVLDERGIFPLLSNDFPLRDSARNHVLATGSRRVETLFFPP